MTKREFFIDLATLRTPIELDEVKLLHIINVVVVNAAQSLEPPIQCLIDALCKLMVCH